MDQDGTEHCTEFDVVFQRIANVVKLPSEEVCTFCMAVQNEDALHCVSDMNLVV